MDNKSLTQLIKDSRAAQDEIMALKGEDYTRALGNREGEDRLANFKWVGEVLNIPASSVCAVYWLKHIAAICRAVMEGELSSEPLAGRFDDEANYSILLRACMIEEMPEMFEPTVEEEVEQHVRQARGLLWDETAKSFAEGLKAQAGINKRAEDDGLLTCDCDCQPCLCGAG